MSQPTGQHPWAQADIDFAVELLNRGEPPEDVQRKLVERGMPQESAAGLLNELFVQAVYADAVALLNQGHSPAKVKSMLTGKGLDQQIASSIVDDILARHQAAQQEGTGLRLVCGFFGGVVFVIGVGLFLGNITGAFPTFPFCGFIVMGIGGAIWGAGESQS